MELGQALSSVGCPSETRVLMNLHPLLFLPLRRQVEPPLGRIELQGL